MTARRNTWQQLIVACAGAMIVSLPWAVQAQSCGSLLGLFQSGGSIGEIADATGLSVVEVENCRSFLSRPITIGPEGPPPIGAAGFSPRRAAGPPPIGAAGPPPIGAAGPPPIGRTVRRLP